ncbi:hypothetical protein V6C20_13260 [Caldibacillus thermoamylovorans]
MYYRFIDDAYYCPSCNLWFEENNAETDYHENQINPNAEEDYALVLDFQAKDQNLIAFKEYMNKLNSQLEQDGYNILKYMVETGQDGEITSYKPYHMELMIHSNHAQKEAFNNYMDELFERFLITKGIILNHYSLKELNTVPV